LGGPGLGVAVDQVQQGLALDVERLLAVHPGDGLATGSGLEEGDRVVELLLVHPDPPQLVPGQVVHRADRELEDGLVVLLGLGVVVLVEVVVADDLVRLEPSGLLGYLPMSSAKVLSISSNWTELAHLVRQVEGDLVRVVEVRELAEQAVVELHRLLLQQLGLRADDGALVVSAALLHLEEVHVPALLHVELGQAELEVRQVRGVAALGDEPLGLEQRAVHLEDVPLELLDDTRSSRAAW
jgi:hypothetical protein